MQKECAIKTARYFLKTYPEKERMFIYRIGCEWMFTSYSERETQNVYLYSRIKEYQEVFLKPDKPQRKKGKHHKNEKRSLSQM